MHPDSFDVDGLAAGSNTALLLEQVRRFQPRRVSVSTKELAEQIRPELPSGIELFYGSEGLVEIAAGGTLIRSSRQWWAAWACSQRLPRSKPDGILG